MQASLVTTVFLPIALGIIMLGLGLSLTWADFGRVARYPRAVLVGLSCQMVVLPAVCFLLARAMLPPELAVGLMLLAASPGGPTANLFSHLAKGDVALNVTLTAVNSLLSLLMLPWVVNFSLETFLGSGQFLPLQFGKVVQAFAVVVIPVAIGMLLRAKKQALADRLDKPVRAASALFLVLLVVSIVLKERHHLAGYFRQVGVAALLFNVVSLLVGYFVPRFFRIEHKQAVSIGMEIGVHNGTLAIAIASSPLLLNNSTMAIPAAIYSLIMFFTAAAFGAMVVHRKGRLPDPSGSPA